jgi:hypothetical protein
VMHSVVARARHDDERVSPDFPRDALPSEVTHVKDRLALTSALQVRELESATLRRGERRCEFVLK